MRGWLRGFSAGLALLLGGCSMSPFGPSPQQQLGDLTVWVAPLKQSIRLVDGRYRDPSGRVQARLLQVAGGEIGGDRGRDAAGVLEVVATGRGVYYQLLAAVEQGGRRQASSIYLGERLKLDELRIEAGRVEVALKRPRGGELVPTLALTERYRWQAGKLQELTAPLVATRWELVELWGRPLQVAKAVRPHMTLGADQRGQIFGGCNELAVGYRISGATLRLDGVGGGAKYCADTPEEDFIGALIQIDRFVQQGAMLELYSGDEVLAKLRAAAAERD